MSDNNNNDGGISIGFPALLFLVFLVLKLTKVINWSWLWVTSPLWITTALGLIALVLYLIGVHKNWWE